MFILLLSVETVRTGARSKVPNSQIGAIEFAFYVSLVNTEISFRDDDSGLVGLAD
jgi:hypothetical protein